MNRIQRIATASAIGAAVLVPATGAAVAVARSDPGRPMLESSSLSKPQSGPGRMHVADERTADQTALNSDAVPWAAIGLAAVAGATVTAGTMAVVRHNRHEPSPGLG